MTAGQRDYLSISASYWIFTISDAALRMVVLLHFFQLGFSPFQLAMLFFLYELAGIFANLVGGWLAGRFGIRQMLLSGFMIQIGGLLMLSGLQADWPLSLSVLWVLLAQGLAGIAKDVTKTASKSAIKESAGRAGDRLFKWTALFTGSKNAIKGGGFFTGGLLLGWVGFEMALYLMAAILGLVWGFVWLFVSPDLGKSGQISRSLGALLAKSPALNWLSAARVFLFAARDIWFVVGLPVFLYGAGWNFWQVGGFLALWTAFYGLVQMLTPSLVRRSPDGISLEMPAARRWAWLATVLVAGLFMSFVWQDYAGPGGLPAVWLLLFGLSLFGFVFAVNSSVHSYLVLALAGPSKTAESVGFYYAANALGRLGGTLLSGWCYGQWGMAGCLAGAGLCLLLASLMTGKGGPSAQLT